MKIITRGDYPSIKKRRICEEPTIYYEDLDLNLLSQLIQDTITNYTYNTIDLITLLRENYHHNLTDTIKSIKSFSNVRFNCYYASKILKAKLEELGLHPKYISYKSIGFSSPYGDNLIKEAHMALLLPTKRANRNYYLILDPGYRLPEPLGFYPNDLHTKIIIDHDIIKLSNIAEEMYPYSMDMEGYNRYSINDTSYKCTEYFDANYETINPEEILFPLSYKVLDGYRAIRYSDNPQERASIKIMLLDKYIECFYNGKHEVFPFHEFQQFSLDDSIKILTPYTDILQISPRVLAEDFNFIINNNAEFIHEVIEEQVLKEKTKAKK